MIGPEAARGPANRRPPLSRLRGRTAAADVSSVRLIVRPRRVQARDACSAVASALDAGAGCLREVRGRQVRGAAAGSSPRQSRQSFESSGNLASQKRAACHWEAASRFPTRLKTFEFQYFETGSHAVAGTPNNLIIFQPQPSREYWDDKLCFAFIYLFIYF